MKTMIKSNKLKKWEAFPMGLKWKLFFILVSFYILPLVTCPLWGQVMQKKSLIQSDPNSWGELIMENVSPDEQWVSFRMQYKNGMDTLFVKHTSEEKKYAFAKSRIPTFANNNYFICQSGAAVQLLNLKSGNIKTFPYIDRFDYSQDADQLLLLNRSQKILEIVHLKNFETSKISNIESFSLSPDRKKLLLYGSSEAKNKVGYLLLENKSSIIWIVLNINLEFQQPVWHKKSTSIAFLGVSKSEPDKSRLYFFKTAKQKIKELSTVDSIFPAQFILDQESVFPLKISEDSNHILFGIKPIQKKTNDKEIPLAEIWNTKDKFIYLYEQKHGRFEESAKLASWNTEDQKITIITSTELPSVMMNGTFDYAVVSNPKEYEPQFELLAPRDYYLLNLKNQKKELIVKNQSGFSPDVMPSPSGKFIAYFKDNNWWNYDIILNKHYCLTNKVDTDFFGKVFLLGNNNAYGIAGWTTDDKEIIIYDQYDLWVISPDGSSAKKLTSGREKNIVFRISKLNDFEGFTNSYDGDIAPKINFELPIILSAVGIDAKTGIYIWTTKNKEQKIIYENSRIDKIHYLTKQKIFVFQEQRFNLPPRIMMAKKNGNTKCLYQSNPQFSQYAWGRSELMQFTIENGKKLSGALYYPADFDPSKKYPMIVHIYEKQSNKVHLFENPNLYFGDGFSPAILTSLGYLVLCPDIEHQHQKIGESIVDCTVNATKEIIARGLANPEAIGLIGHSFGGYSTNQVVTKTNIFKAAVSGASITDLVSFYLNLGWDSGIPDMVRFTNEQWRMEKTPFEAPELYASNSPVMNAASINTPLLIWSGKADNHVNWHQSMELYLALRRLGKTSTLLLYPGEMHNLAKPKNQIDLTTKIIQWFDYYLKNEKTSDWIKGNI